jgi:hypothetical protein
VPVSTIVWMGIGVAIIGSSFDKEAYVRTLIAVVVAGVLLAPLAAAARPGGPSAMTVKVSTHKVLYGHRVVLRGRLWGRDHAGRKVTIDARAYGASAPRVLAVVSTDATGRWSFGARPRIQTAYQAHAGATAGPRMTIGVAPAVFVTPLAGGRLRVHIRAAHRFDGRFVQLQARSGPRWTTIDRKELNRFGTAVFTPPQQNATLRFAMSVNQAGAGYLGAASHALVYRPQSIQMQPSTLTVLYGHRVTFAGQVVNGRPGELVTVTASRWGHKPFLFATVKAGPGGRFSFAARPGVLTSYVAHLRRGEMSPRVLVNVRPTITVRQLGNGRIQTHVAASKSFRGRMVQLQRLIGNAWQTIAKQPLHAGNATTFAPSLPNSVIRVAMSVNQAGSGFMGSTSHAVLYHAL